ncbi:uncharacterized protein LOC134838553 [Culicoides brevitarsis]|uniref:uncharacterized protein LOC134838553 n=1 Tax=Culicoides brevitarsis TaxID=469753 RepID=UPI00307C64BB
MKNFLLIVLSIAFFASICEATNAECEELKEKELQMTCEFSDFDAYRKCVKERKEIRRKRATICPITGKVIDIDTLSASNDTVPPIIHTLPANSTISVPFTVTGGVVNDTKPRPIATPVEPEVNHNWIVQGEDTHFTHNRRYHPASNVTTVIKLTNHINNTNIVNVPTHINSTNVNNITIYTNSSENFGDFGFGVTKDGPCCMVVKPRTCHTGPMGIRCHHKRHKMCSMQCTSRIMHVRSHRSHGFGGYIPQPTPSCVYMNQWPFVNCGNRRMSSCAGCYEHYGSSAYYPPSPNCYGCYDEGFQYGQMYRRGPVLRPHYYHEPPMYYEQGYYPPPAYGFNQFYSPEFYAPPPPMYPNHYEPIIVDDSMSRENSTEKKEEGDWGVAMQKCKVISDDGSITIANCTVENDHPYAAAPNDFSYPEPYPYPSFYPQPQPYPRLHHRPTTHKIAPLKNKSNEVVPREINVQQTEEKETIVEAKTFPEDDPDEEEKEGNNNEAEEQITKEEEKEDDNNDENSEGENQEDYDYET